jgi:hypothetical protein
MSATSRPQDHTRAPDQTPRVTSGERPAAFGRLDVLIGTWEMEARFEAGYFGPGSPAITGRGCRRSQSVINTLAAGARRAAVRSLFSVR